MTQTANDARLRVATLVVEAALQDAGKQQSPVAAYAFSSRGRLLSSAPIDENSTAQLQIAMFNDPQEISLLVGPQLREGAKEQAGQLAELRRLGAEEQTIRVDPQAEKQLVRFDIAQSVWSCWLRGLYVIRGHVAKRLGTTDLPIVDAEVDIYEVDPIFIIIPRLPDAVIEDIRHILDPLPPTEFPTRTSISLPTTNHHLQPLKARSAHIDQAETAMSFDTSTLPESLKFAARNASTFQLRQDLLLHPDVLRHILCLIHPMYVTKQLVATATTDRCGEFRALASQGCSSDTPDLYFVVKQRVLPLPFPAAVIYAPTPVPCYTYWNYISGTDVAIHVTNPLAIASPPCPDHELPTMGVVVEAIGNTPVSSIFGASDSEPSPVTDANRGLTHDGRPWGGLLRLRLDFDPALRANNIRYYRAQYRRGNSGAFIDLDLPIRRIIRTYGGADPTETTILLGPQMIASTQHLYEIPPELPLTPNSLWAVKDLNEDLIHAKFPTAQIAPGIPHASSDPDQAGMFQLRVDLFDSAGNPVDLTATGVKFYVSTSSDPAEAGGLGLVQNNGFQLTLHVDNNPCFAQINAPVDQNNVPAGDDCGVIEYGRDSIGNKLGNLSMSYTAAHRNGFATYSFHLYRGAFDRTLPTFSGTPAIPVNGAPVTGLVTHTQPIAALMAPRPPETHACDVAGFSENLYVDALATDGLSTELGYDAAAVFAFALAPQS